MQQRPHTMFIAPLPPPPSSERVLMNVHPDVREDLRNLLMAPEFRGVGYSAFIQRAISLARAEVVIVRTINGTLGKETK